MDLNRISDSWSEAKDLHNENYKIIGRCVEELNQEIDTIRKLAHKTSEKVDRMWNTEHLDEVESLKADRGYMLNYLKNLLLEVGITRGSFADKYELMRSISGAIQEVTGGTCV